MYITRDVIQKTLNRLISFHAEQDRLHSKHGIKFTENLGRRNIIISRAQEIFLAQELRPTLGSVIADGRPGQPDILIEALNIELECKITSPQNGRIVFQTDHGVLEKKGSTDYIYIICDESFSEFSVLHFLGLTTEDFKNPGIGSRGRAAMNKAVGMKKCRVLFGDAINLNLERIKKIEDKITAEKEKLKLDKKKNEHERQTIEDALKRDHLQKGKEKRALKDKLKRLEKSSHVLDNKSEMKIKKMLLEIQKLESRPAEYKFVLEKF